MYKICTTCKENKLFCEFHRSKARTDGYDNRCKNCIKTYNLNRKDYFSGYREDNRKKLADAQKQYRTHNKDKINADAAKRRAIKLKATPLWLTDIDWQNINKFYKDAQSLQLNTGKEYHVDHIVPLQGENVCGLHVPWNLQILLAKENLSKHNKLLD